MTKALNAGMPMVLITMSADQPYNAACCAALGTGQHVCSAHQQHPSSCWCLLAPYVVAFAPSLAASLPATVVREGLLLYAA